MRHPTTAKALILALGALLLGTVAAAQAQTTTTPPAASETGGTRPTAPSTGQTVPDPRRPPATDETRGRDTGAASGAAGPNIPGTGTPRISTDTPSR